ncbi:hypothetical protein ACSKZ4_004360 [Vibrio alginolyticus]|nr:hypothetical protein [Vibrio alginolyticus]
MREQETTFGLQSVSSSGEHHTSYNTDINGEKEKAVIRIMRRKVDSTIRGLPPSSSLAEFEIALLKQGIELELTPDKTGSQFKCIAYQFHQYRFAGSSLKSGNKYTLGKLIKNNVLAPNALVIENYDKHQHEIEQATQHFAKIRTLAIDHANKLRKQLEEYEQNGFLLFAFSKAYEAAMQAQIEYWFEYAKRICSSRDKPIIKAIYECERGIYKTSGTMSKLFYHLVLIIFEFALYHKAQLEVLPTSHIMHTKQEQSYTIHTLSPSEII